MLLGERLERHQPALQARGQRSLDAGHNHRSTLAGGRADLARPRVWGRAAELATLALALLALGALVATAGAEVVQSGVVRVTSTPDFTPEGPAARYAGADHGRSRRPHLDHRRQPSAGPRRLQIGLNSAGQIEPHGLPVCPAGALQSTSSEAALERCGPALVGSGISKRSWLRRRADPGDRPRPRLQQRRRRPARDADPHLHRATGAGDAGHPAEDQPRRRGVRDGPDDARCRHSRAARLDHRAELRIGRSFSYGGAAAAT